MIVHLKGRQFTLRGAAPMRPTPRGTTGYASEPRWKGALERIPADDTIIAQAMAVRTLNKKSPGVRVVLFETGVEFREEKGDALITRVSVSDVATVNFTPPTAFGLGWGNLVIGLRNGQTHGVDNIQAGYPAQMFRILSEELRRRLSVDVTAPPPSAEPAIGRIAEAQPISDGQGNCSGCGTAFVGGARFCASCGLHRVALAQPTRLPSPNLSGIAAAARVPKCLSCGYIGIWTVEALLLPRHLIIAAIFLFFWGGGLIYIIVTAVMRSNENSRAKICPRCAARNMWTFDF